MSAKDNSWATIYQHLKAEGYAVYSMGQHKGPCVSPYVVVRSAGSVTLVNMEDKRYELLIYVPATEYSEMETMVANVKAAMKQLAPLIKLWRDESPHYLDNDVKGYMTSLTYRTARAASYVGI